MEGIKGWGRIDSWTQFYQSEFVQGAVMTTGSKLGGGGVRQVQWYLQLRSALDLPPYTILALSNVLNSPRCWRLLLVDNLLELLSFFPALVLHEALMDIFPLEWSESSPKVVNLISVLASGAFAGGVALLVLHPLAAFRVRCFASAFNPSVSLLPRSDVLQLYRGLSMSFFAMVLYRGAYVGIFSIVRRLVSDNTQPYTTHVLAAALAGVVSYPLDVVANHQMATAQRLTDTVSLIVSKGGRQGLFAGLTAYLVLSPVKGMCAAGAIAGTEMMVSSW